MASLTSENGSVVSILQPQKSPRNKSEENIPVSAGNWYIFVKPSKSHYTDWAIPARNVLRPVTFKVIKFRDGNFKRSELTFPGPLFGARATGVWRWTINSIPLELCGILDPFWTIIAWCLMHVSNLHLNSDFSSDGSLSHITYTKYNTVMVCWWEILTLQVVCMIAFFRKNVSLVV
jgi:hypothetical protein